MVVIENEHHRARDRVQIIEQGRQNDLHRVGTHRQEFDRASPHPGTDLLQRRDHVHPKPHRVIVGTIKRQPAKPLVRTGTQRPLRQQCRLAPARGRTQQRQLAASSRRQCVEQGGPVNELVPDGRDVQFGGQQNRSLSAFSDAVVATSS